ncbi:glycerate kinase [Notoacmeibacter sp. MSK16QG-6]|uniref:glycerate kinase type-2 family protein n=1 Tax=Notoacmeibacter sp. MSK16QG-6 TaxID=2957982 RepID=UPI0020A192F4|nr:DUF4147 domain-containing protein [Notoacmeibacter sp. MSK16QG-6]MCP1198083.1 DUF4147 domain-containing protein [Notoacmeibacter sp. MSK16QG-6]
MTGSIEALRQEAVDLFRIAVDAADPGPVTARALEQYASEIEAAKTVTLLAFGKGAVAMAKAALPAVEGKLRRGVIVTTDLAAEPVGDLDVIAAGHPVPNDGSLAGGKALARAASEAEDGDLVLVLISGGGSALAVYPVDGLELSDKIALNQALLRSGADIVEMNALRSAASRLKGGGLARLAHPARVVGLILSDVPGDDPSVVASGPTVSGASNLAAFKRAAARAGEAGFPRAKLDRLIATDTKQTATGSVANRIVGSNSISLYAAVNAARERGWKVMILDRWLEGDVQEAAERIHAAAYKEAALDGALAILSGGETSVTVTGDGLGGRNQELALRFAGLCQTMPIERDWCFLSGGTDGRDGPTDAAGGLVDAASRQRMLNADAAPDALLANNDSYKALAASSDLLMTGPTGTNVADIQIFLMR